MRRLLAVGFVVFAVVVYNATLAGACVHPDGPYVESLKAARGAPGTTVVISGDRWDAAPVTFHWASASGAELGTATGPGFSTSITIPADAARGQVFYVYAIQGENNRATPFEVTAASNSTTGTDSSPAGSSEGSTSGGSNTAGTNNSGTSSGSTSGGTGQTSSAASSANESSGTAQGTGARSTSQSGGLPTPAATAEKTPATASAAATGTKEGRLSPSGNAAAAPSTSPRTGRVAPDSNGASGSEGAAAASLPSLRSASGKLISGYVSGPSANRIPSLMSLDGTSPGTPPLAVGLMLATGSLIAIFAGFAVAEAGRRRLAVGPVR